MYGNNEQKKKSPSLDEFKRLWKLERIISNERRPSTITTWPYLLIIKGYPEDLQIYLIEYVHLFVDVKTEIANSIKEKFLAVIIKWMTNC
ncbi:unnamed protein product [Rotaria sp. Silwood1]|nr:unnamed protein product [Rotaria sp. Silwood1]